MPTSCHCEETILAPFVTAYNRHAGTRFSFKERLDVGGNTPEPEALYVDEFSGNRLVIERKNVVWPRDYVKVHHSLHMVTGIIADVIKPHVHSTKAYRLAMPDQIAGPLAALRSHGRSIGETIVKNLANVHGGQTIGSEQSGREWSFRLETAFEREYTDNAAGVRYVFNGKITPLDWGEVPSGLEMELLRLLSSASRKFSRHADARRIVVVDFMGDMRYPSGAVLDSLFRSIRMPAAIDDVWYYTQDLITDVHYGWVYQQLWPTFGEVNYELSGETVNGAE